MIVPRAVARNPDNEAPRPARALHAGPQRSGRPRHAHAAEVLPHVGRVAVRLARRRAPRHRGRVDDGKSRGSPPHSSTGCGRELVGEGFYEPIDDIGPDRTPTGPKAVEAPEPEFRRQRLRREMAVPASSAPPTPTSAKAGRGAKPTARRSSPQSPSRCAAISCSTRFSPPSTVHEPAPTRTAAARPNRCPATTASLGPHCIRSRVRLRPKRPARIGRQLDPAGPGDDERPQAEPRNPGGRSRHGPRSHCSRTSRATSSSSRNCTCARCHASRPTKSPKQRSSSAERAKNETPCLKTCFGRFELVRVFTSTIKVINHRGTENTETIQVRNTN